MSPAAPAYSGAEAELDAYAAQAAHQLGEAVALLRGYLVVLEQRGERDPELGEALRGLSAGTERAQRFVDDLLDLAAAGRTEPAAELVALDEALDAARATASPASFERRRAPRCAPRPAGRPRRPRARRAPARPSAARRARGAGAPQRRGRGRRGRAALVRVELRDDGSAGDRRDPFAPFARARGRGPLVGAGGRAHRQPAPRRAPRRHDRARPGRPTARRS